jgi:YidC/Oxa1 family membrane protein insertase
MFHYQEFLFFKEYDMKIKDLLMPFALALITTWALQYFFSTKEKETDIAKDGKQSGQRFVAPQKSEIAVHKPLNLEIDFLDVRAAKKPTITSLETENAQYEFTTNGAALARIEFKHNWSGKEGYLATIHPPSILEKENSTFLVALAKETPFYYELTDQKEEADRFILTYQTALENGILFKTFTVFKKEYRIDLALSFTLKEGSTETITPRIFFMSPLVSELGKEDIISGIVNTERNGVMVNPKNEQTLNSYWADPTLFGSQDRYFVHAMVNDPSGFAQRGYYKIVNLESIFSILEGPSIQKDNSWKLTFYMGPKEDEAMALVDPRLEQTLNYGWFSFISKPLSKFLLYLLNYFNDYINNYGLAIIILTILFKLLLLPFTYKAEESVKKRVEFQKKLEHLQTKYKNDAQALAQARADLVKRYGMPGLGGCLPLFLQLPFFWALSIILSNAIELYKAPFLWIPDLTAPDPYYILPILMVIGIILHSPAPDPKQQISSVVMGIVVGVLFANFAAGLALYFVVSTFLSVLQTTITKRFAL